MAAGANSIRYVLQIDDQGSPRLIRFGQNATSAGNAASNAFRSTTRSMASMTIAGMGVTAMLGKIATGTMAVVEAAAKYDSLQVRLKGIEGGAKGAAIAFDRLQELSKLPGLGFEQAADAYAGLRSLRQDGPEAIAIIEAFARANASMGGGAEEFGRAMRQIQQIIGKGKLMAEDVNTIAESIPNFRAMMLDAFGTTDASKINDKNSMKQFLEGIVRVSKDLPKAGETIRNNLDNLSDAWVRLKASMADTEFIKSVTADLAKLVETLTKMNEKTNRAAKDSKDRGFDGSVIGRLRSGNSSVGKEIGRFGLAMATNGAMGIVNEFAGGWSLSQYVPGLGMESKQDRIKKELDAISGTAASLKGKTRAGDTVSMSDATKGDKKERAARTAKDVNIDYWEVGGNDLRATQARWNNARGVDRDREEKRRQDAKAEMDLIFEISEKEIAYEKEIARVKAEIVKDNLDRIRGYYNDIAQNSAGVLTQSFMQIENGFASMGSAILDGFKNMLIQMAAEVAANAIVFGALTLMSPASAGVFAKGFGGLSGLLMGHATGGGVGSGEASIIGERRAEIFVPRSSGRIEPTASGSGQNITIIVRNPAEAQSTARALRRDERQRNTGLR
jgi:tape measure domain-containing protein